MTVLLLGDFTDVVDSNPGVAEDLEKIKLTFIRESPQYNLPKVQSSDYKR